MSRDHTKLRVFHAAHTRTKAGYRNTCQFPRDEFFRLRFLHVALGWSAEVDYLVELAEELGFAGGAEWASLRADCRDVVRQLQRLVDRMEDIGDTPSSVPIEPPRPTSG